MSLFSWDKSVKDNCYGISYLLNVSAKSNENKNLHENNRAMHILHLYNINKKIPKLLKTLDTQIYLPSNPLISLHNQKKWIVNAFLLSNKNNDLTFNLLKSLRKKNVYLSDQKD